MAEPVHKTDRAAQLASLPSAAETRLASIAQVITPGQGYSSVTDKITQIVLRPEILPGWLVGFVLAFAVVMMFLYAVTVLVTIRTLGSARRPRTSRSSPGPCQAVCAPIVR